MCVCYMTMTVGRSCYLLITCRLLATYTFTIYIYVCVYIYIYTRELLRLDKEHVEAIINSRCQIYIVNYLSNVLEHQTCAVISLVVQEHEAISEVL